MTYFGFLALFLLVPIVLLAAYYRWRAPRQAHRRTALLVVGLHVLIALVYTTPWDNYLVATRVWWYDPDLVTGLTIGWVPIEEYTFFILQPIMTGLWLLVLRAHWLSAGDTAPVDNGRQRRAAVIGGVLLWLLSLAVLFSGWGPGTYLGLELGWALPPILLQFAFGADILWRQRRLVLTAIAVPTLYLALADALAISSGTWTINPEKSLEFLLGGILPFEELVFFLLTNTLIVFGVTLALAPQSRARATRLWQILMPARNGNVSRI
jgi:lycopene cyclase domain-containing protein